MKAVARCAECRRVAAHREDSWAYGRRAADRDAVPQRKARGGAEETSGGRSMKARMSRRRTRRRTMAITLTAAGGGEIWRTLGQ